MKKFKPRELRRLMSRAGINVDQIESVERVEIHLESNKVITVSDPTVTKMTVSGQTTFQVVGQEITETTEDSKKDSEPKPTVLEEDVVFVAQQASVGEDTARKALEMTGGDLAQAILMLKGR